MPHLETTITIGTRRFDLSVEFGVLRGRSATRHSPPEYAGAVVTAVQLFDASGQQLEPVPAWLSQLLADDPGLHEECLEAVEDE
jgi:hypothetical protein